MQRHSKPFECPECTKGFGSKKDLERHRSSIHAEERPFVCLWPACRRGQQGWARRDNYRRHVQMVHSGVYAPPPPPAAAEEGLGAAPGVRKRRRADTGESVEDEEAGPRDEQRGQVDSVRALERVVEEKTFELELTRNQDEMRRKDERIKDLEWALGESRELLAKYKEMMHSRLMGHAAA